MSKIVKLAISVFVGIDIFVMGWLGLAQLRFILFGTGAIPGGGSALDMALFLIPIFLGYLAADRLYHFLTYKERRERSGQKLEEAKTVTPLNQTAAWDERGWQDQEAASAALSKSKQE